MTQSHSHRLPTAFETAELMKLVDENPGKCVWGAIKPDDGVLTIHVDEDESLMRLAVIIGFCVFHMMEAL